MENITMRKKIGRSNSEINISMLEKSNIDLNSTFLDSTVLSTNSEPQNNVNDTSMEELTIELLNVRQKLTSAELEIENLNIENNRLIQTVKEQTKQIDLLKKLTQEITSKPNISTNVTPVSKRLLNIKMRTPRTSPLCSTRSICGSVFNTPNYKNVTKTTEHKSHDLNETKKDNMDKKMPIATTPMQQRRHHTEHNKKHRVIIIADNQGRNVRPHLQNLLGPNYLVTSFIKPNAVLGEVISSMKVEIQELTMNDYVILLAGSNDKNPYDLSSKLDMWLSSVTNTNVIVGEIPRNYYLHETKLNYNLKYYCTKYVNAVYIDMNYSRAIPHYKIFALEQARSLLREILRISYQRNIQNYLLSANVNINRKEKCYNSVSTQTDMAVVDCNICSKCDIRINQNDCDKSEEIPNINNNLFRD